MIIHGKELESYSSGDTIYYGNKLLKSKQQNINEYTDLNYWADAISKNPEFCTRKASGLFERSPQLVCSKQYCKNGI